jgi:hypothetical protein
MASELFRKNIEPACCYCSHGTDLGSDSVMCIKKGVVSSGYSCPKFSYDPFMRRPPEPKKLDVKPYSEEDFSL